MEPEQITLCDAILHGETNTLRAIEAVNEVSAERDRLRLALQKIADHWPCSTADDMSRVAREALGK